MAIPGYRILRKIRQGGMSTVYLAIQQSVDREVAIKVMSPNLNSDPSFSSRFYREAKIVGKLSHHNIVSIYDVGNHKHYNYIAMDFLPGIPLQDRLAQGVSTEQAIRVVREMASALHYAHERGYVHRDIKPDNILFREDDSAVLCDFGIAKALKNNVKMTNFGAVLGTPNYMSPEQAQGKEIDGRADIYSLGVVFYEMLTGQLPFTGEDPVAIAVKHMTSAIPKLPADKKAFQAIIEKMMAKKASSRFQTGAEIITALDELEQSLNSQDEKQFTQSGFTSMQMLSIFGALFSTLTTVVKVSFQRFLLSKSKFSSETIQLSEKQQQDLDTFILNDDNDDLPSQYDDLPLIQDTIKQAPIKYRWSRLLIVAVPLLIAVISIIFWAQQEQNPEEMVAVIEPPPEQAVQETLLPAVPDTPNTPPSAEDIEAAETEDLTALETPEEVAPIPEPEPESEPKYALTINTQPSNARVRILNIKPRYTDGILLEPGNYRISVSAPDYLPQKFWVKLKQKDLKRHIKLQPGRRLLAAGTLLKDKLKTDGTGPTMVVQPRYNNVAIAISQYEITFAEYDQYAQLNQLPLPDDFGWGRGKRPVVGIDLQQAKQYAAWLSEQTGQHYRLPTQAEWQRASLAGSKTTYWWGTDSSKTMANCRRGCDSEYSKFFSTSTAPVGSYKANPYGLFDTAGNVAEWLDSCTNPEPENSCQEALVAGGSHQDSEKNISASSFVKVKPEEKNKAIGLRLVLDL